MTRLYIFVEGETEESFVNELLAPALWRHGVHPEPRSLGGRTAYRRLRGDVIRQLKQDRDAYCSTMIDLYGIGKGYPEHAPPANRPGIEKVQRIETAFLGDICAEIPDLRPEKRFIPYLQLHEYEAVLFSDPTAFAQAIYRPELAQPLIAIRTEHPTPEDIDDSPETTPSKRILALHPRYSKVIDGTHGAMAVGLDAMRAQCPHFRHWLETLETLSPL
ncbi:MAG: DUF4276 family protein [Bryobacteraceae bacterium]